MGSRYFTTYQDDYNYGKESVSARASYNQIFFDMDVSHAANPYIRLVIRNERTNYTTIGKTTYITRTRPVKPKKITIDEARLVILGGPFQEIGGKDEAVGGGSQKVGEANK